MTVNMTTPSSIAQDPRLQYELKCAQITTCRRCYLPLQVGALAWAGMGAIGLGVTLVRARRFDRSVVLNSCAGGAIFAAGAIALREIDKMVKNCVRENS